MPSHYEVVDGVPLPTRLGGHPALDFCNTWAGWDGVSAEDFLRSYADLALWAGFVGLLGADRVSALRSSGTGVAAARILDRARTFRAALYDVLREGPAAVAFPVVADEVRAAAAGYRLVASDDDIAWQVTEDADLAAPLFAVAWSAAGLLTSPSLVHVHACPGTGCGWLFLDPQGRRRWCSMAACGNRAKARRFAARQRSSTSAPKS
jgi:predicted RNA-binding Zn ribbon-like protein